MSHLGASPNSCHAAVRARGVSHAADHSCSRAHLPRQLTAVGAALYYFALNFFAGQLAGVPSPVGHGRGEPGRISGEFAGQNATTSLSAMALRVLASSNVILPFLLRSGLFACTTAADESTNCCTLAYYHCTHSTHRNAKAMEKQDTYVYSHNLTNIQKKVFKGWKEIYKMNCPLAAHRSR